MSGSTNLPARPLARLVARAAGSLAATTGATARAAARPRYAIVADTSASMKDRAGQVRKIDALRASLDSVLVDAPDATVIAFGTTARPVAPGRPLPEPEGGTALHLALEAAADHRRVLVISDGQPDSEEQAMRVARRMAGTGTAIDALFIGDDDDLQGIAFMRRLASVNGGRMLTVDLIRQRGDHVQLTTAIRQLALPAGGR